MQIGVLRETAEAERRVAATPETVKKLIGLGASVVVESGAGAGANISNAAFSDAGATVTDRKAVVSGSDLIFAVQGPDVADLKGAKPGATLVAILAPFADRARIDGYAKAGLTTLAMELMPRITRAQSMDVLSSQSNLSGYKAVIDAAESYGRAFPMMMTAAGTISAARVFVMGVGVAGLQAIATARRLGALVSATDVRAATKEQIESLGAKAIFVENVKGIEGEGTGGYATEMSDEYKAAQAALVSSHIAKQDIVITTALIPGRPAPRLITDAQVASMKPGSVIVDLAAPNGGNCPLTEAGKTVIKHGVTLVGETNLPALVAADSSALYARNVLDFLKLVISKEGAFQVPLDDDIVVACLMTQDGQIKRN